MKSEIMKKIKYCICGMRQSTPIHRHEVVSCDLKLDRQMAEQEVSMIISAFHNRWYPERYRTFVTRLTNIFQDKRRMGLFDPMGILNGRNVEYRRKMFGVKKLRFK